MGNLDSIWKSSYTVFYARPSVSTRYGNVNQNAGVRVKVTTLPGVICDGGVIFLGNNAWSLSK